MPTIRKWGPHAARVVLGLVFLVFSLNFFLSFLPTPPLPEKAVPFITGLAASGYVFPVIKGIELAAAVALLANRFVPLALTLLAPIVVNIVAFHVLLAPPVFPISATVLALELYLAWAYRGAFVPMLQARVTPTKQAEDAEARTVAATAS